MDPILYHLNIYENFHDRLKKKNLTLGDNKNQFLTKFCQIINVSITSGFSRDTDTSGTTTEISDVMTLIKFKYLNFALLSYDLKPSEIIL